MTQRRVENTRVHFWTFSPVSVKGEFLYLDDRGSRRKFLITSIEVTLIRGSLSVQHTRQFNTRKHQFITNKSVQHIKSVSSTQKKRQKIAFVLNWRFLSVELKGVLNWYFLCWTDGSVELTIFLCWNDAFDLLNWRILGVENDWPLCWTEGVCVEEKVTQNRTIHYGP